MEFSPEQDSDVDMGASGDPPVDSTQPHGTIEAAPAYPREEVWHQVLDPGFKCLMPRRGTDVGKVERIGRTVFQTLEMALPNSNQLVPGGPEGSRMDLDHPEEHAIFSHGFNVDPPQEQAYLTDLPELDFEPPPDSQSRSAIRSWDNPLPNTSDHSSSAHLNVPASRRSSGSGSGGRRSGPGSHRSSHSSDGNKSVGSNNRVEKKIKHRVRGSPRTRSASVASALEKTTKGAPQTTGSVEIAFNPCFLWNRSQDRSQVACPKYLVSGKVTTRSMDPEALLSRVTDIIRTRTQVLEEQGPASLGFLSQGESSEVCDEVRDTFEVMHDLLVADNPNISAGVDNVLSHLSTVAHQLKPKLNQRADSENNFVDTVRTELHKPGSDPDYSGINVSRAKPIYSVYTPGWPNEGSDRIFHFDLFGSFDQPDPDEIKTQLERSVASSNSMEGVRYHASLPPRGQDSQQILDSIDLEAMTIE